MELFLSLTQYGDIGLLILRIGIGVIFLIHGISKRKMWSMQPSQMPMLNEMKILSVAEPLGGLAMLLGFLTQIAAIGLGIIIVAAIYLKMNKWNVAFTYAEKPGWEFDWMILSGLIALLFLGAGTISLDYAFFGF